MYKIYFGNRYFCISPIGGEDIKKLATPIINCKNKKSFDNAYNDFQKDENLGSLIIVSPNPDKYFKHLKKKFKVICAAGGLVENSDDKILVMKRNDVWDLPKGKIEKGEKKKQAAIREVEEECGISELVIKSKIGKSYHTYVFSDAVVLKITHWYKMFYFGNNLPVPQTSEGITEIKWIVLDELKEIQGISYPNLNDIFESVLPA